MFVRPGTKTVGEIWDRKLDLYLDVEAQYQSVPFWWVHDPERYKALQESRHLMGVEITDHLFGVPTGVKAS